MSMLHVLTCAYMCQIHMASGKFTKAKTPKKPVKKAENLVVLYGNTFPLVLIRELQFHMIKR